MAPESDALGDGRRSIDDESECPLPLAHDRFFEAHWHLHQMLDHYHFPMEFRFSTNAFLHSLKSVLAMLRIDLERRGENAWRKARFEGLKNDPILSAFSKGRDLVVHRGVLVRESHVEMGYFKFDRVKLVTEQDIKTDEPSHSILARIQRINEQMDGLFVPVDHPWIGEQLGVRRQYMEPQLSAELDVVTASDSALSRVAAVLGDAHKLLGFGFDHEDDESRSAHDVERVWNLLESDVDPSLIRTWNWD